jgi:Uncharacterized protein involved in methicillin resistance
MELCTAATRAEYDNFVWNCPKGHWYQSPEWGDVKALWKWVGIIRRDDSGKIKGTMSLLIRQTKLFGASLVYAPRGPVCDPSDSETITELISDAKEAAKLYKGYALLIDPDIDIENKEFADTIFGLGFKREKPHGEWGGFQSQYVFRIDMGGKNEEELLASFHQKTRYNIRLAERKGVVVTIESPDMLPEFHELMVTTGERDGFTIRPLSYFQKMMEIMGEHTRLYIAKYNDVIVAGAIAVHYGDKVWYAYGASSNEYRNVMPNYLVQWKMIQWACENNCRIYDFIGVASTLDDGLYRFKKGWGGELNTFIGELKLSLRPCSDFVLTNGLNGYLKVRKLFKRKK